MDQVTAKSHLCKLNSHEEQQLLPYICVSKTCDSKYRYLCQQCLLEVVHCHNDLKPQLLQKEIILSQFQSSICELKQKHYSKSKSFYEQYQRTLKIITEIERIISQFKSYQSEEYFQISQSDENYFESLTKLIIDSFFELSPDNFNKILNISEYKLSCQQMESLYNILDELMYNFEQLKISINSLKIFNKNETLSHIDIEDNIRKIIYSEQILPDLAQNETYFIQSKISPNNQYLAILRLKYGGLRKTTNWGNTLYSKSNYCFNLIDLLNKQKYKLQFKSTQIDFFLFSTDSKQLYYKENNEPFYCFSIDGEQLQEYRHFPELMSIQYILATTLNRAFVINKVGELFLLDMRYQYIVMQSKTKNSKSLIFDDINKIVISAGDFLEFWDQDTGMKVHQGLEEYKLEQLQLNSSQGESNLLASEQEFIYRFQIQYSQDLIQINELQKFKYEQNIISFNFVLNKQYCIIFGEYGSVKIYNQNFQMIKHIFIGSEDDQKNKQFDLGQCSNDLSSITVISYEKNICVQLTKQVQK